MGLLDVCTEYPPVRDREGAAQLTAVTEIDDVLPRGSEDARRLSYGQPVAVHAPSVATNTQTRHASPFEGHGRRGKEVQREVGGSQVLLTPEVVIPRLHGHDAQRLDLGGRPASHLEENERTVGFEASSPAMLPAHVDARCRNSIVRTSVRGAPPSSRGNPHQEKGSSMLVVLSSVFHPLPGRD